MRMKKAIIIAAIIFIIITGEILMLSTKSNIISGSAVTGDNKIIIYEFYGKGCPHCTKLNKWFEEIKPKYPELEVMQHEVYKNSTNRKLFQQMAKAYGKSAGGVPVLFIGDTRIVGFSNEIGERIEAEILKCKEEFCASPLTKLDEPE